MRLGRNPLTGSNPVPSANGINDALVGCLGNVVNLAFGALVAFLINLRKPFARDFLIDHIPTNWFIDWMREHYPAKHVLASMRRQLNFSSSEVYCRLGIFKSCCAY